MVFRPLAEYLSNSPSEQQMLSDLLYFLVTDIENNKYPNELTANSIQVDDSQNTNPLDFMITTDKRIELTELTESQKIRPICEIILFFFKTRPSNNFDKVMVKVQSNPQIIKEFKSLLSSFYSRTCCQNYKMLVLRIKNIHELFGKDNTFTLTTENLLDKLRITTDRNGNSARKKLDLQLCNYCGSISLEPMFHLNACLCKFHKQCFESAIVSTIEFKELKQDFELSMPCSKTEHHFSRKDLEIIVEIEKDRFTLSKPINLMIRYYYLYWQEPSTFCNCKVDDKHFKVKKLTKRPEILCNGKCSFCGNRWEEECPKFKKALNWAF